jgi:protein XRP2
MLFSQTEPIIESSSNITFLSAQNYYYAEFYAQMKQAKLSIWNNKWTEVFDFSKKEGGSNFAVKSRL